MGMFDYLVVELPLPGGLPAQAHDTPEPFQTKSLECLMEKYVISSTRELYVEKWEYDWVDEPEHFLGGFERKLPESYRREYLTNYHGDIIFYNGRVDGKFREYTARFTEGILSRMWYTDLNY
jgi:hypothetical protein